MTTLPSLLPADAVDRAAIARRHRRPWLVVLWIIVGAAALGTASVWRSHELLAGARDTLGATTRRLTLLQTEHAALAATIDEHERLGRQEPEMLDVVSLLGLIATSRGDHLSLDSFDLSATGRPAGVVVVKISGEGREQNEITGFIDRLRSSGAFHAVELEGVNRARTDWLRFTIRSEALAEPGEATP